MGITRRDLEENLNEQDRKEITAWIERASSNDIWANKIFKKVGILMTSHSNNRLYLKACVESHKKLGYWMCLAYDNFINPESKGDLDYNKFMPAKDVIELIDTFILTRWQNWGGVLYPYFWLLKLGSNILQDFEYIYCINGDFILEKPENFEQLFNLMGDADFMGYGPDTEKSVSTGAFIIKSSAFKKIMRHFQDHFIPFEVYEKYTQDIGNTEGRFARAIKELKLKIKTVEPPYNEQMHIKGFGTWYNILGLRHIHAEHNFAYRNKKIPPHYKYLDKRFMGNEYDIIKQYWDTNDISVLENWWVK